MADMTLQQVRDRVAYHADQNAVYVKVHTAALTEWKLVLDAHLAGMGEPVAWAAGLEPTLKGWIDTKAWTEGEFTIPLYAAPPASGDWDAVREVIANLDNAGDTEGTATLLRAALPESKP